MMSVVGNCHINFLSILKLTQVAHYDVVVPHVT